TSLSVRIMPHHHSQLRLLTTCLATAWAMLGATYGTEVTTSDRVREQVLRMTEFFDTNLPGVLQEHNMTLHVKPKFSDLRKYEYWRFPLQLRHRLTDNLVCH